MRHFTLTNQDNEVKEYTIVVDTDYKKGFSCQDVYHSYVYNDISFMNIYFKVDDSGKVVDISIQVND